MKNKVDKLDIGKLETTPVDLIKLSDIVKNDVKKTEYYELVKKVNNIKNTYTSNLLKKAEHKSWWHWKKKKKKKKKTW